MANPNFGYQGITPGPLSNLVVEPIVRPDPSQAGREAVSTFTGLQDIGQQSFDRRLGNESKLRDIAIERNTFAVLPDNATQFDVQALNQYQQLGGDVNDLIDPMSGKVDTAKLRKSMQAKLYISQLGRKEQVDKNEQEAIRDVQSLFLGVPGGSQFITHPDGSFLTAPELMQKIRTPEGAQAYQMALDNQRQLKAASGKTDEAVGARNHTLATLNFLKEAKAAIGAEGEVTGPFTGSIVGRGITSGKAIAGQLFGQRAWANDREKQRILEMVSKQNVLEAAKAMKGNLSNKDVAFLEQSVPTLADTEDIWAWYLDLYEKMLQANLEAIQDPTKRNTRDFTAEIQAAPGPVKARVLPTEVPGPITGTTDATKPAAAADSGDNKIYNYKGQLVVRTGPSTARPATPEEIKAGRRLK